MVTCILVCIFRTTFSFSIWIYFGYERMWTLSAQIWIHWDLLENVQIPSAKVGSPPIGSR